MLLAALFAGCSGSSPEPESTATAQPASATATAAATATPVRPETPTPSQATATVPPAATATPPPSTSPAVVLSRGPAAARTVALTFDAGSDRGFTAEILDTLAREGIVAGFGMTGPWAEEHSDLVRRIAADGHIFINHTYAHRSFTGFSTSSAPLTRAERFTELDRLEEVIAAVTGRSTKPYFRPPFGDYDASVNADVGLRGYGYNVMWTVDSRGWMGIPAAEITQRCLELAEPGAIYIFHVGSASADAQALPAIISGLRAAGYSFAPFSDYAR